jgi:DNA-binding protein HU-beta
MSKSNSITKTELIKKIKEEVGEAVTVESVINKMAEIIPAALLEGNNVTIDGLGILKVSATKERQARNPKTGETITVPASRKVKLSISTGLKKAFKQ